jgi:hypothetical protein
MNKWIHSDGMKDQIVRFLINVNQFHKSMTNNSSNKFLISNIEYFFTFLNIKHLICKVILKKIATKKKRFFIPIHYIFNMLSWSFIHVIYVVDILLVYYYMWFYKFIFDNIFCY